MATVRYGIPSLPSARRLYSARPAYGADAVRLADTLNHLAGYRFARMTSAVVECDDFAIPGPPLVGLPGGPLANDVVRFVHRVSPQCPYLWLTLDYQLDDEGTGGPSITARVDDLAAVAVDVGVRWSLANGLVGAVAWVPAALGGYTVHPIQTLITPPRIPSAADLAGPGASMPRLLDVSTVAAAGGGLVQVVVTCVQARVCTGSVWDWPSGEV